MDLFGFSDEIRDRLDKIDVLMKELKVRAEAAESLPNDAKIIALNAISSEYREIDREVDSIVNRIRITTLEDPMRPMYMGEPIPELKWWPDTI